MKVYESVDQLVGHTPLLELKRVEEAHGVSARILGKLEYFNPAGSIKDRIAKAMIDDAEAAGILKPGANRYRANLGKYGNRTGFYCGSSWLPAHFDHARNDERRAT